jgi:hypothetical protein
VLVPQRVLDRLLRRGFGLPTHKGAR